MTVRCAPSPCDRLRMSLMMAEGDTGSVTIRVPLARAMVAEVDALRKAKSAAARVPDEMRRAAVEAGVKEAMAAFDRLCDRFAGRYGDALARARFAEGIVTGWFGYLVAFDLALLAWDPAMRLATALLAVLR